MLNLDILKNPLNWVFVLVAVMGLVLVLHLIFRSNSTSTGNAS